MEWGVGPGGGVPHRGGCPAGTSVAGHILEGTLPGLVRSQGEGRTMRDPEPEGTGEYPSSALLGAPVALGRGRQTPNQARDLVGWNSGELPSQVAEQLASWPPGMPSADQPPASALRRRAAPAHRKST
jgi:hypothetical protein